MPKTNRPTDRAHVIMSFDLNQRDFDAFVTEIKASRFFPNLIGLEVKRPNNANPVIGLGALLLRDYPISSSSCDLEENGIPQVESVSTNDEEESETSEPIEKEDSDYDS